MATAWRVSQFREGLHVEAIIPLGAVALRCGDVCAVGKRLAGEQAYAGIVAALRKVVADLELVLSPAKITRCAAEKSSESARNIFVLNVCKRVRQVSPGKADLRELMLWVAIIGMHFG